LFHTLTLLIVCNYKDNYPRCVPSDNVPSSSRNTIVYAMEYGLDIKYQVNPMEEDDTNNTIDPDDGTHKLI
jgi:hypothetical protein